MSRQKQKGQNHRFCLVKVEENEIVVIARNDENEIQDIQEKSISITHIMLTSNIINIVRYNLLTIHR